MAKYCVIFGLILMSCFGAVTTSHALPVEINMDNLVTILTTTINDNLISSATVTPTLTVTIIVTAARQEMDKLLAENDATAVATRFETLLKTVIPKGASTAELNTLLRPAVVQNLFKAAVADAFKRDVLTERIDELAGSVNDVKMGIRPKIIRPNKEAELLFDIVVGDTFSVKGAGLKSLCTSTTTTIVEEQFVSNSVWPSEIKCYAIKGDKKKRQVIEDIELSNDQETEYRMIAVEKKLGLKRGELSLVKRIGKAQNEVRNYDWDRNQAQLTIMGGYITNIKAVTTSLVLHAYPAYRQYIPGRLDLPRRFSIFVGVGKGNKENSTEELESAVYSYGIGIAVREGVGLTVGESIYTLKNTTDNSTKRTSTIMFGITLNAELWKALFGNN